MTRRKLIFFNTFNNFQLVYFPGSLKNVVRFSELWWLAIFLHFNNSQFKYYYSYWLIIHSFILLMNYSNPDECKGGWDIVPCQWVNWAMTSLLQGIIWKICYYSDLLEMIATYQWVFLPFMIKAFLLGLYHWILGSRHLRSCDGLYLSCLGRRNLGKGQLNPSLLPWSLFK